MKHFTRIPVLVTVCVAAIISWSCDRGVTVDITGSDRDRVDTLQSGGLSRSYALHLPNDYATDETPVVMLFHSDGGSGLSLQFITTFDIFADTIGFIAVYPNATSDWAYGCDCTDAEGNGVDDIQFVADLLDELDADFGIDRDSVFAVGLGEGALMAQKLACDATDILSGIATVAATMSVPVAENCVPSSEIPVLMIHGNQDLDFPWDGAPDLGLESLMSADSAVQFWATSNGCGDRLAEEYVTSDSYYYFDVFRHGFDSCPVNGEVILLGLEGAGHGWPDADFHASDQISEFFVRTPL